MRAKARGRGWGRKKKKKRETAHSSNVPHECVEFFCVYSVFFLKIIVSNKLTIRVILCVVVVYKLCTVIF